MEQCDYHTQLVSDIAVIKTDLAYIKDKVCKHIQEGEEKGGFRDRLLVVEREVCELKRRFWGSALVGGVLGALIGSGSRDIISTFVHWIMQVSS
jgi:hypothetical protein